MTEPHPSRRFPALYRAVEKMNHPRLAPAQRLQRQPEFAPEPARPSRPVITAWPLDWIEPAPSAGSPELRTLRMARIRAERELAHERQRVVQAVAQARHLQQQKNR